jgi:hypothetical protein
MAGEVAAAAKQCLICGQDVVKRSKVGRPALLCGRAECERARAVQRARSARTARWHEPEYQEMVRQSAETWRRNNPDVKRSSARRSTLKNFYGLTVEQYDAMLAAQGGGCAICGAVAADSTGRSLHVDHDHNCCPGERTCGKCVRGLLCRRCNLGIAHFNERADLLVGASQYLSRRA